MGTGEFIAAIAAGTYAIIIFSLSVAALANNECQSRSKDLVIAIAVFSGLPLVGVAIGIPIMFCVFLRSFGAR